MAVGVCLVCYGDKIHNRAVGNIKFVTF